MLNNKHLQILQNERKLEPEILARYGITSSERSGGGEWISIPYLIGSDTVNRKYRTIGGEKKFSQEPDGKQCFWNSNALMDVSLHDQPIIITEGEFDALSAIQAGFVRAVSVPNGAPSKEIGGATDSTKYRYFDDAEKLFSDEREIIIAVDNDAAGTNLLNDLAIRLGKPRCKWVKYPYRRDRSQGRCKDLNEVLQAYGEHGVTECIRRAEWMKTDGVYAMDELPPITEQACHKIGFPVLDNHYQIRRGDFCVVTGIPSHGKSSFLNDVACRMAMTHGWRIAFASFEQTPQTDHKRNLLSWHGRKHEVWLSPSERAAAEAWINQHFRFIVPSEDDSPNLQWVLERCAMAVIQHGCDMIVIDPWNELDHERPRDMSLTEYTGFAIKEFKRLARKYNIHLVVAAHPAKMRAEGGAYDPPTLYDISDSAHWANKADVGISVFRPDMKINETEIHVKKVRYQPHVGMPGIIKTHFITDCRRYECTDTSEG